MNGMGPRLYVKSQLSAKVTFSRALEGYSDALIGYCGEFGAFAAWQNKVPTYDGGVA